MGFHEDPISQKEGTDSPRADIDQIIKWLSRLEIVLVGAVDRSAQTCRVKVRICHLSMASTNEYIHYPFLELTISPLFTTTMWNGITSQLQSSSESCFVFRRPMEIDGQFWPPQRRIVSFQHSRICLLSKVDRWVKNQTSSSSGNRFSKVISVFTKSLFCLEPLSHVKPLSKWKPRTSQSKKIVGDRKTISGDRQNSHFHSCERTSS